MLAAWRAATQAWLDELVVGHSLCPWAASSSIRYACAPTVERCQMLVATEAARLLQDQKARLPTTLIVLEADLDVASFAAATRGCRLPSGIELLAFHPDRLDVGPGCSKDPLDAAHYSVRSPLPTLQLLRTTDVEHAREDFRARSTESPAMPGALPLLFANKRKLRRMGSPTLQRALERWRARWALGQM